MGDRVKTAAQLPKVLIVSNYFPPQGVGGAEIVAFRQAKALREIGWSVKVFTADFSKEANKAGLIALDYIEGLPVVRVPVELHANFTFLNPFVTPVFAHLLREFAPDVAHFHNVSFLGFNLIGLAEASGAKTVVTLHDRGAICFKGTMLRNDLSLCTDYDACASCASTVPTPDGPLPPRLRRDYAMAQIARAHMLLAPSRRLAEDFIRAGADTGRMEILSSGIDLSRITPRLRDPGVVVNFVCAAYLGEHKGIHILAKALKLLWAETDLRHKWRFLLAGDGPLAQQMRDLLCEEDMSDAIELFGRMPREKLLARLAEADVAILPSICIENQPVWLLEGLGSGAALIASAVGGNVELVKDGVNGLLYPRDNPTALAAAMRRLIVSPELVRAFSAENLRRRERFDESAAVAALDRIYRSEPTASAVRDVILVCGLNRDPAVASLAVESVPQCLGDRRIRLVWWQWLLTTHDNQAVLWIFSLGWRPWNWMRAAMGWGWRPFLKYFRSSGDVMAAMADGNDES